CPIRLGDSYNGQVIGKMALNLLGNGFGTTLAFLFLIFCSVLSYKSQSGSKRGGWCKATPSLDL
ncbi:hypothetical protein, partial [Pseudanabaena sp. 'Roaring Creek']|uniref:hypothetical protein n=1 Tax=Pseudanabaena sp. 'Roaring Creek' TaxID=1681830 RepID=UPI001E36DA02